MLSAWMALIGQGALTWSSSWRTSPGWSVWRFRTPRCSRRHRRRCPEPSVGADSPTRSLTRLPLSLPTTDVWTNDAGNDVDVWASVVKWGRGGLHSTEVAFFLLTQQPRVWFPALPKFSQEKFVMLLRFITCAGLRWVDSGLKMFIEPI